MPFDCFGKVGPVESAHVVLAVVRDTRAQVSLGGYTFRFAIVERSRSQLFLQGRILGPGNARPPGITGAGGPVTSAGHRGGIDRYGRTPRAVP